MGYAIASKSSKWSFSNKNFFVFNITFPCLTLTRSTPKSFQATNPDSAGNDFVGTTPPHISPPNMYIIKEDDKLRDVFDHLDVDKDGKISSMELVGYFGSVGESINHQVAKRVVNEFDSDGDELLDFGDFVRLMKEEDRGELENVLRSAFEMFEAEKGCGCITPKGLQQMLRHLGDVKSHHECEAMIRAFDIDGNGFLDFHEFQHMMSPPTEVSFGTLCFLLSSKAMAQQNYTANSVLACNSTDTKGPSSAFLYTCNGLNKTCSTFLIFKSQPPFNSTTTISNLTTSNPQDLARINNATLQTVFQTGKEVIVPVNCSCPTSGEYYQAESTYILPKKPTYFTVANDTYQGLVTCDSLKRYNPYGVLDLLPGMVLHVPLRCACPTEHQTRDGTKYLLTYSVNWGDNISNIATRFNVPAGSLIDANGFSSESELLYPFTTVLIPLPSEPNSSMTIVQRGQPIIQPPPFVFSSKKDKTEKKKVHVIVASLGGFMVLLCFILSVVFVLRKSSARLFKRGRTKGHHTNMVCSEDIREEIESIEHVSKVYKFEEIKEATEDFSASNRIKGSVFRGLFGDEREVLVIKKMSVDATKEVNLLGKINHFNLIKLQGYCKKDGFFYLVFEYMENGSLREWLGKNRSNEHQSWAKRIQIALDIANGLQYLHSYTEPCYVHKGINTDNILLNRDLRAKIANFTLAKESQRELSSFSSTSHVVGTRGYMAPEYLDAGLVSSKMDVYAYGVVLLELITGKDSIVVQDGREVTLSSIMVSLIDRDDAEEQISLFIDPSLSGNIGKVFALQLVKLSLSCLIEEPGRRPNIAEVISSLMKMYIEIDRRISPSINHSASIER